jgi:predicted RNA-binding Zn-ribbon protein involved in translation (DUF1610 family)
MFRCPHCLQKTISLQKKLLLDSSTTCPECRYKFQVSGLGRSVWIVAVVIDGALLALVRNPVYLFSLLLPLLLALAVYLWWVPLVPAVVKAGIYLCPHCHEQTITRGQKSRLSPWRTVICSACGKPVTIGTLYWVNMIPLIIMFLIVMTYDKTWIGFPFLVALVFASRYIQLKWVPLVKK